MDKGFKVIVVGGGPMGLTVAHALYLAGIDFVVFERRPAIVEDKGASLVVYPHTFRVMHQFGLMEALLAIGGELHHHQSFTADGNAFKEGTRYGRLREKQVQITPTRLGCLTDSCPSVMPMELLLFTAPSWLRSCTMVS